MAKLYVSDTWADLNAHWYANKIQGLPVIVQNSPGVDHKRAVEVATTQGGTFGWYWAQNQVCGGVIDIDAWLGLYHQFDNTRAGVKIMIGETTLFDDITPPDVPYLKLGWGGNEQGWANGTFNHQTTGSVTLGVDPVLDFTVAEPDEASYNKLDELEGKTVHVLCGYSDGWSANWSQWGSAHKDSWIDLDPSPPPPPPPPPFNWSYKVVISD